MASRLHSFKTETPGEVEIFMSLSRLNRVLLGRAEAMDSTYRDVLDIRFHRSPGVWGARAGRLKRAF